MPMTRRGTLLGMVAGTGLIGAERALAWTLTASDTGASSRIGRWSASRDGLPVFEYLGALPAIGHDRLGEDYRNPADPMFILGNYRLTAFPHVSGVVEVLTGERNWARLNASAERLNYADHRATLTLAGTPRELIGMRSLAADPARCRRRFGTGFAAFSYTPIPGVTCTRTISVKPSERVGTGNPSLIIRVTLTSTRAEPIPFSFVEQFANRYVPADLQQIDPAARPVVYDSTITVDIAGNVAVASRRAREVGLIPTRGPKENNPYDMEPAGAFLHAGVVVGDAQVSVERSDEAALRAEVTGRIAPRSSVTFDIVYGIHSAGSTEAAASIADLYESVERGIGPDGLFTSLWSKRLPVFADERNAVLRREMRWNAYVLEAMATYNRYFNETFLPQGQMYTYQDGENISNRDHFQALLPMCSLNPPLAKSSLRYALKHTEDSGEIKRGNKGVGFSPPGIYKESDEQLYLFMALGEYLRTSGDYAFLDETVSYYPAEAGKTDTVLGMLTRHFVYLRDEIGTGPNGLIKMLNSDWSDSFFHTIPVNIVMHSAESHMNSAMALAVMPPLIDQLQRAQRPQATRLIAALEAFHDALSKAYLADLGQRDFSARAYMNDGKPAFGVDIVTIEAQGFLLQIPGLPTERKRAIYRKVKTALQERAGFRIHERPIFGRKPEGEDGAIWPALQGQFIKGVASFDRQEARRLLEFTSFDSVARAYPDYWLGHWTSFDNMQSSLSPREGLFGYWVPSIFTETFAGFCSHPHSWPLYNYMLTRVQGH